MGSRFNLDLSQDEKILFSTLAESPNQATEKTIPMEK